MHTLQLKKLGEICEIKTGKKDVNEGNPNGDYPFFTCAREHTYSDNYSFDTEALLIAGNGDVGHVSYYKGKFEAYQRTYILLNFKGILPQFLFLFLSSYLKETVSKQKLGNTMPYIKMGMLTEFEVTVPSLSEQRRIIRYLDEVFEKIEKAKENTEKNLKNSGELFQSYLQSVFVNTDKGWSKKRFDEVCVLQRGFDLPTRLRKSGDFALVSSNGITDRVDVWKVKAPGVVTGRSGTIGNIHFINEEFWPLNTALYIKDFHGNDERFIFYFLRQFNLGKHSSGAGVPTLNRNNVHSINVSVPKSLFEQKTIVKKLDTLSEQTKKLESIYKKKFDNLEELKKSILKKAFRGEL